MKLELKHLAGYLPYGLKIQYKSMYTETLKYRELEIYNVNFSLLKQDKPILHKLSDLTKEIEVNGEKFVPNDLLNSRFRQSSKDLFPYKSLWYNLELDIQTENYSQSMDLFDGFLIVTQLLEWHFDIYGLIDAGLAIDINTLK